MLLVERQPAVAVVKSGLELCDCVDWSGGRVVNRRMVEGELTGRRRRNSAEECRHAA